MLYSRETIFPRKLFYENHLFWLLSKVFVLVSILEILQF